jgi:hypothetical protein
VIPSVNFDSDKRPLVVDLKNVKIMETASEIEIFKLQNRDIREEYQNKIH